MAKPDAPGAGLPEGIEKLLLEREVEAFLQHEATLLDDRRFEEWQELFTDDGYYWAPARLEQDNPHDELSLFYDDRELMKIRGERLRHPRVHSQTPPSRTSHIVGSIVVDGIDDEAGAYAVRAKFHMLEYRPEMAQRAFGGNYEYHLIRNGAGFKIASKKATIINCDATHFPLALPF